MLYVLVNQVNGMYFEKENDYMVCQETNEFINAKTYKDKKDAMFAATFLKNEYEVVGLNNMQVKKLVLA